MTLSDACDKLNLDVLTIIEELYQFDINSKQSSENFDLTKLNVVELTKDI
jgi:hypothetical protein